MRIKYYLSLREAFSYWYSNDYSSYDNYSNLQLSSVILSTFVTFLTTELGTSARDLNFIEEDQGIYSLNEYAEEVIEYIIRRYARYTITDVEDVSNPNPELLDWLERFVNILSMTLEKYSLLINLNRTKKNELINAIKTIEGVEATSSATSNSRYNDTPQNYQGQESYNDDDYSTNQGHTSSTGGSEVTTTRTNERDMLVERIATLDKYYLNLMLRWSNEFKSLFMITRGLKEVE